MELQKELDKIIEQNQLVGAKPKLLLHCCCAPCASYCVQYLSKYFQITLFFFNPNITDSDEYERRLVEVKRLSEYFGANICVGNYEKDIFFTQSKGLENEPECGARCLKCYELRLRESARVAKTQGFDYFCTTLSISPHKNAQQIYNIGKMIAGEVGIEYLPSDFKKKGGFLRSVQLCEQLGLYRQNYCGCEFSKSKTKTIDTSLL